MRNRSKCLVFALLTVSTIAVAQAVREKVRVGLVSVILDARTKDGHAIVDLQASDLTLLVDGKPTAIEGLDAFGLAPPLKEQRSDGALPKPDTITSTSRPDSLSAGAATDTDLYVDLFYDETGTNASDRRETFRQLASFVKDKTRPGVHVMLQRFDGRLHTECPWTTDPTAMLGSLTKMEKSLNDAQVPSPGDLKYEVASGRQIRDIEMQVDINGQRSADGLLQALVQFPAVSGRKALVIVTDGTSFMTPYDLSMTLLSNTASQRSDRVASLESHGDTSAANQLATELQQESLTAFGESVAATGSWANRMARITNKATELDIALYPADSESPDRGTNPGTGSKWPGRSMPGVPSSGSRHSALSFGDLSSRIGATQSMSVIAAATGGQAILNPRQIANQLDAISDAHTAAYVLTLRDPSAGDGKYHHLDIATRRSGVQLIYRQGYRIRSDDERILDNVVAHLATPTSENPFAARLSFELLRKEGGQDVLDMRLEYSPTEASGDPTPVRDARIWAICSDDKGNRAKPVIRNVRAPRVVNAAPSAFGDSVQISLPPGSYTWSVAVRDGETGVTSYVVVRKDL